MSEQDRAKIGHYNHNRLLSLIKAITILITIFDKIIASVLELLKYKKKYKEAQIQIKSILRKDPVPV